MRGYGRVPLAAVTVLLVAALLGACSLPRGVDGNLTNGWPEFPSATLHTPATGDCYAHVYDRDPVDCAVEHDREAAFVGTFTGAPAGRNKPPLRDGPDAQAAWLQCAAPVAEFLGGDWHDGLLLLELVLPTASAWSVGARWYRCDVSELEDPWETDRLTRTASLRAALKSPELRLGCLATTKSSDGYFFAHPAPCDQPHHNEYVGFFVAPNIPFLDPSVPADPKTQRNPAAALAEKQCWPKIEAFVGTRNVSLKIGWSYSGFDKEHWGYGDRSARCFAGPLADVSWTATIKGLGSKNPKM